jgi:hypothetical protein
MACKVFWGLCNRLEAAVGACVGAPHAEWCTGGKGLVQL